MKNVIDKLSKVKYLNAKKRIIFFGFGLLSILLLSSYLFTIAYSKYEVKTKILANIDKALYIFGADGIDFNLDPTGIIPSDSPYVYKFSVSNFNNKNESDVDLTYNLKIRTTTNLPISIGLYRNELYDSYGSTNILPEPELLQDSDGAWYRCYNMTEWFNMNYVDKVTDVYTIVIYFPSKYKKDTSYADYLESIEIILESKQVI